MSDDLVSLSNLPGAQQAAGALQAQAAPLVAQGQTLYTQANAAANGDLGALSVLGVAIAKGIAPGPAQTMLNNAVQIASGAAQGAAEAGTIGVLMMQAGLTLAAGLPVFGAAVGAMVVAAGILVKDFGASGTAPGAPFNSPAALAMQALPIPGSLAAFKAAQAAGQPTHPVTYPDPTAPFAGVCSPSSDPTGLATQASQLLGVWRDYLEYNLTGTTPQFAGMPTTGSGFTAPTQTQTKASLLAMQTCLTTVMGGQSIALAAVGRAVSWVPFGEGFLTFPLSDGFPGDENLQFDAQIIAMAYQGNTPEEVLSYLLSLAWLWESISKSTQVNTEMPPWLHYKIGFFQSLVTKIGTNAPAAAPPGRPAPPPAALAGNAISSAATQSQAVPLSPLAVSWVNYYLGTGPLPTGVT